MKVTVEELMAKMQAMEARMESQDKENAELKAQLASKDEPARLTAQLVLTYKGKPLTWDLAVTRKGGNCFHVNPGVWKGKEIVKAKGLRMAGKLYLEPEEVEALAK